MSEAFQVYCLLDLSASMTGAPIEALKQGLQLLFASLSTAARRPRQLNLIGYESGIIELAPLEMNAPLRIPDLDTGGTSALGHAVRHALRMLTPKVPARIFIFTDGTPTDDWQSDLRGLRKATKGVYVILCGPKADSELLKPLVTQVFRVNDLNTAILAQTLSGQT